MPSADFCHAMASPYGSVSPLMDTRQIMPILRFRCRKVNTHLSAHERRVYLPSLRWIEDFTLCCRLVPPGPPNSVLVHRPACGGVASGEDSCVRGTLPRQGGFLPEHRHRIPSCHTAIPFASIRLGLGLAKLKNKG